MNGGGKHPVLLWELYYNLFLMLTFLMLSFQVEAHCFFLAVQCLTEFCTICTYIVNNGEDGTFHVKSWLENTDCNSSAGTCVVCSQR